MTKYLDLLILVNKTNSLPADFVPPDLVKPDIPFCFQEDLPKKYLRREAAQAISRLIRQAQRENIHIYGVSAYRSYQTQKDIFTRKARELGEKEANRLSAYPGQSEHQTGLAIDLTSSRVGFKLTQNFGSTPEGRWLSQNAADFGFIIRYPAGKEHITGYSYEPWHLRYVGVEAAQVIADKKITLEEYLRDYPSPNW
ncbi:MAG: M15 family metallopeptidase [Syntrophomonadaceae bacterium]|nr:M15 family metallopeptidase [Syntrophomonadaceae bacterium]